MNKKPEADGSSALTAPASSNCTVYVGSGPSWSVREMEDYIRENSGPTPKVVEPYWRLAVPANQKQYSNLGRNRETGWSHVTGSRCWKYYPPSCPSCPQLEQESEENRGGVEDPKAYRPLTTGMITCLSSTNLPAVASDNYHPNKDRERQRHLHHWRPKFSLVPIAVTVRRDNFPI